MSDNVNEPPVPATNEKPTDNSDEAQPAEAATNNVNEPIAPNADPTPTVPTAEIPASIQETNDPSAPAAAAINATKDPPMFPCMEQPVRVTLYCRTIGYYLWGIRKGRVVARKKRSEKDEFRFQYISQEEGIVEIINHKFGGKLQVVVVDGVPKVVWVKDETADDKDKDKSNNNKTEGDISSQNNQEETVQFQSESNNDASASSADLQNSTSNVSTTEDEGEDEFEDEPAINIDVSATQIEDRQWCFVRGAGQGDGVLLKSLRTGDFLAIDASGKVLLTAEEQPGQVFMTWDIESVSGELLFLSNPRLNRRIRCDMAGLLTLTDAWKGWEVFRVMETGSHHYVKISSWMHSQWFLCSTATGEVTCCSHADSLKQEDDRGRCAQWAIEKAPEGNGVIIRSKSHGRFLCVNDGALKTRHPNGEEEGDNENVEELLAAAVQQSTVSDNNNSKSSAASSWWNNSMKSMNESMRKGMNQSMRSMNQSVRRVQKRMSQSSSKDDLEEEEEVVPPSETLVWQLEAAHQQTYYFLNTAQSAPRSIGPIPYATSNLRQTEKIQIKRTVQSTKLYLPEKEQYVACSSEGDISLVYVYPDDDKSTEWVMEKPSYQEGGSVFRSKHYNFYLSYSMSNDGEEGEAETSPPEQTTSHGHFKNPFGGKTEPVAQLIGSETVGPRAIWNLEPSMPRAVSSEKIKTFAIGTGIAVGTTIAMPFALAGASAVLGAVGAEAGVLFNAIAVGLTGAEALASVGAIGATAYIVFRPEENSLTDDHKKGGEEEGERAWSKRPFSNWRNW